MTTKIVLADDHEMMRQGLRAMLEREVDLEVIGEAGDGVLAMKMARELKPDVLVMDVAMPGVNGIEATREVVAECPQTKIVALSIHSDRNYVIGMLSAGASGYVHKASAFEELVEAIRKVARKGFYVSAGVTGPGFEDYSGSRARPAGGRNNPLTPRERNVLRLLAEGKSTRGIARSLSISISTVETHRRHCMEKLNLWSVAELTKYAIREGLVPLEE